MKKNKLPSLISVLILTLLTSVMWISFSVYRSLTTKPAPAVLPEISEPLTPTLDSDTMNQIESRIFLNDSEIPENIIITAATPVPTIAPVIPSPTPVATPEAATQSAVTQ